MNDSRAILKMIEEAKARGEPTDVLSAQYVAEKEKEGVAQGVTERADLRREHANERDDRRDEELRNEAPTEHSVEHSEHQIETGEEPDGGQEDELETTPVNVIPPPPPTPFKP